MKLPLSDLVKEAKQTLIDMEVGQLEPAQFFLTNVETSDEIQLAMPPEEIHIKTSANFRTYQIVELGEISIPKGEKLLRLSWDGIFPNANILLQGVGDVLSWDNPQELIKTIEQWKSDGDKIHVLITSTPINFDFYIRDFNVKTWKLGHWKYSIDFIAALDLVVKTVDEVDADRAAAQELKERPRKKSKLGERLKKIDDIWAITKILTGNGSLSDVERLLGKNGLTLDTIEPDIVIWN